MTMSSHNEKTHLPPPLDLFLWSKLPAVLMTVGAALCIVGLGINQQLFGFSWLLAFMFYLSLALGALFVLHAVRVYLVRDGERASRLAMRMFGFSILYLFLLFAEIVGERALALALPALSLSW